MVRMVLRQKSRTPLEPGQDNLSSNFTGVAPGEVHDGDLFSRGDIDGSRADDGQLALSTRATY